MLFRYLRMLFPNSKFVLMVRDGRATAYSIISRGVTIQGFDITSYRLVTGSCAFFVLIKPFRYFYAKCLERHYILLISQIVLFMLNI